MTDDDKPGDLRAALEETRRRLDALHSTAEDARRRASALHEEAEQTHADADSLHAREIRAHEQTSALREALEEMRGAEAGGDLGRRLFSAHAEALRVGDSPLRADQLADRIPAVARAVDASSLGEEAKTRIHAALADAERVLRRDDDGREAAKHLERALRLAEPERARKHSPFADDE